MTVANVLNTYTYKSFYFIWHCLFIDFDWSIVSKCWTYQFQLQTLFTITYNKIKMSYHTCNNSTRVHAYENKTCQGTLIMSLL